ncbi:M949_RS01915 family surface polysaccharide biosynthesis protein [Aquimarina algiphila]|uniref:M949_RS01915 family surface polysaccharide biosynthesis protein n=1 Tax=Aquimarina algiphila TaxID=2047982 RepID=UPI0024920D94|nr:hypothetical protein [Aquimarina algiphila]
MNRFLFFVILLALFSCQEKSKESKNNSDQKTIEQDTIPKIELKKLDSISIDPKWGNKLSEKEIKSIFNKRVKMRFDIEHPIHQAYSYTDESGKYYLVLSLSEYILETDGKNDTLNDKLQSLYLTNKDNRLKKKSSISDEIDKDWESSISFWNKYSEFSDLDKDGLVDLILVYGTTGQDMYADGRMKIMIYHNKRRITIRHQNSEYGGRLTKINGQFYGLPLEIQKAVKEKMKLMTANKHAIFSKGWEQRMAKEATDLQD